MATFTYLSRHAFKRIEQRTKLQWEEVTELLDQGLFVDTGHKPGYDRHHLLFYSAADETCFVAIQDKHSGTVVTILTLDYHKNLAWEISNDLCERARKLYEDYKDNQACATANPTPSYFMISGHYVDGTGCQKTKLLMKAPSEPYDDDIGQLFKDGMLPQKLERTVIEHGIPSSCMFAFSFRHGKKGIPVVIELR